ncbi:hypothetical protein BDR26DRAFT_919451 [Obelidium mucronatum]|nr:hypothetical protein BDR26DRAFT_919451 [Obelidium mucronatum]
MHDAAPAPDATREFGQLLDTSWTALEPLLQRDACVSERVSEQLPVSERCLAPLDADATLIDDEIDAALEYLDALCAVDVVDAVVESGTVDAKEEDKKKEGEKSIKGNDAMMTIETCDGTPPAASSAVSIELLSESSSISVSAIVSKRPSQLLQESDLMIDAIEEIMDTKLKQQKHKLASGNGSSNSIIPGHRNDMEANTVAITDTSSAILESEESSDNNAEDLPVVAAMEVTMKETIPSATPDFDIYEAPPLEATAVSAQDGILDTAAEALAETNHRVDVSLLLVDSIFDDVTLLEELDIPGTTQLQQEEMTRLLLLETDQTTPPSCQQPKTKPQRIDDDEEEDIERFLAAAVAAAAAIPISTEISNKRKRLVAVVVEQETKTPGRESCQAVKTNVSCGDENDDVDINDDVDDLEEKGRVLTRSRTPNVVAGKPNSGAENGGSGGSKSNRKRRVTGLKKGWHYAPDNDDDDEDENRLSTPPPLHGSTRKKRSAAVASASKTKTLFDNLGPRGGGKKRK